MKATLFLFAVLIVAVSCRPEKSDIAKAKAEFARKKACMKDCANIKVDPICAGKQGEKPKSFGNECVLQNHNCEHKDSLHKISSGQCPGAEGIRLS
ncbi:uncharacterized protein LOC106135847 [Amyelois transitella]|uniref:uncharacterized protein LOC106135847 n=1 Tax=Amyelois transitella TaxID=680683 RepID=UPI002990301F|nr:uncharacterized protein LOC106135847 [Amyelois transitella]